MRRIFLGSKVDPTPYGAAGRNQFYQNYYALIMPDPDSPDYAAFNALAGNAVLRTLVGDSQASLRALAGTTGPDGLAYRYALSELNPFALLGANYEVHNTLGELERYDSTTRTGTLTDAWLEDRADFLYYKIAAGLVDNESMGSPWAEYLGTPFRYYEDRSTEPSHLYAGANPGVVQVPRSSLSNILFGGDAPENLTGGNFADRLYAGTGGDTLAGSIGADMKRRSRDRFGKCRVNTNPLTSLPRRDSVPNYSC